MSALGFLLNLFTDSDDFDGEILDDSSDISDDTSDISDDTSDISDASSETADNYPKVSDAPSQPSKDANKSALGFLLNLVTDSDDFDDEILDEASDILDDSSNISDDSAEIADNSPEISEAPSQPSEDASVTDNTHQTSDSPPNATEEPSQPSENASITDNTPQNTGSSCNATEEPSQPSENASITDNTPQNTGSSYNATEKPSNIPDDPSEITDDSTETTDASYRETNININFNQRSRLPKRSWINIAIGILGVILILFVISSLGDDNSVPVNIANSNNNAQKLDSKGAAPSPASTSNNSASNTEKRCDIQSISKEKHLPKWNIEIIDLSIIISMRKDAEKNHLPFLKINASDNLKQKLETYINKDPSKLHKDSQNTFTCEPGKYIKTASNIGIQLVLCNDDEMSVAFLNLVSPVDNKARVYTAKTFDHLFEDAPVITKTEENVINGERGVYVAVKYEIYSDGTGTEHNETDVVYYIFLGDKLRFLTVWNAFHIEEHWSYNDDGTEDYSCDAKATVLRLENSEAKHVVR